MHALLVVFSIYLSATSAADKDIYAQLGCIEDGTATAEEIILDPVLRIKLPNGRNMTRVSLKSFTIYSSRDRNNPIANSTYDGKLSEEQLSLLARSRPGETIWIEDIVVTLPSDMMCSRQLSSIRIKIY